MKAVSEKPRRPDRLWESLPVRLSLITLALFLVAAFAVFAIELVWASNSLEAQYQMQVEELSASFIPQLEISVWNLDPDLVHAILQSMAQNPAVSSAEVILSDGSQFSAASSRGKPAADRLLPFAKPAPERTFALFHLTNGTNKSQVGTLKVYPATGATWDRLINAVLSGALRTAALLVLLSLILVVVISRLLGRPLSEFTAWVRNISLDDPDSNQRSFPRSETRELRLLGETFNALLVRLDATLTSLRASQEDLRRTNATLEVRVEERTKALDDTRSQLMEASKMAAIGQLVAGISHELNTPIAAIAASARNLEQFVGEKLPLIASQWRGFSETKHWTALKLAAGSTKSLNHLDSKVARQQRTVVKRFLSEKGFQGSGAVADHLVDLGAGDNLELVEEVIGLEGAEELIEVAWELAMLAQSARVVASGADKASSVVRSLRIYSRQEDAETLNDVDLREEMDTVLSLLHHSTKAGIDVRRDYQQVPLLPCRRDRLNQVWINLVTNAIHAMNYTGRLTIGIRALQDSLEVRVADTGSGIGPEYVDKLFLPFFTTKSKGEGTGLGLSISKQIVEEHGGQIRFETGPSGTAFVVTLPFSPTKNEERNS